MQRIQNEQTEISRHITRMRYYQHQKTGERILNEILREHNSLLKVITSSELRCVIQNAREDRKEKINDLLRILLKKSETNLVILEIVRRITYEEFE